MATMTKELSPKEILKDFKVIDVDILAKQGIGKIDWELEIKDSSHANGKHIKLDKDDSYKIRFDLKRDPNDLDVRFDASGPIFARKGCGDFCPTNLDDSELMIDSCTDDRLVVIDWNIKECELHYQLNFVNWFGEPVNPYDPIILNGGGGTRPIIDL